MSIPKNGTNDSFSYDLDQYLLVSFAIELYDAPNELNQFAK